MVKFLSEYINWIMEDKKTTTIRIGGPWEMEVGKHYPVFDSKNGHFQKNRDAVCFINCMDRYTYRYGSITRSMAISEGFNSLKEFKQAIEKIYGNIDKDKKVMVFVFEVAK